MTIQPAALEATNRIADIVAYAVGRVDQRIIPIGMKQRRQRMRFVMVLEADFGVGSKGMIGEK
jgi:hypothetical protein